MKNILYPSIAVLVLFATTAFVLNRPSMKTDNATKTEKAAVAKTINWMSWDEMVEAQKTTKKKVIIDVYTDWCGWCKHMDKTTFVDSTVVDYINENLYAVKLDAETKKEYKFNGHTFRYIQQGRKGINELAYSLLEGKLSYPSIVYLNEKFARIVISPGYKDVNTMLNEVKYVGEEIYNDTTWEEYNKKK